MNTLAPFKVVIVGDDKVGKTTFIHRLNTGEFLHKYEPTLGVEVTPLTFQTNRGRVMMNVWDCSGQEEYWINAQAVIVMFDNTNPLSYEHAREWIAKVKNTLGNNVNIVLVGNKVDRLKRKVKPENIHLHQEERCSYFDLSAKSNFNFEKPFLAIVRHVLKDNNVVFW